MCPNQQLSSFRVIRTGSEPSRPIRQTCISPDRVELNQMYCPSGEYSGPSLKPPSVSRVSAPPSAGME